MTEIITSLREIPQTDWDELAGGDPFISHGYLSALEESKCVGERTGWYPCHLIKKKSGKLVAAMPTYLKHHSYGEYVFDWSWADAYQRHGLKYYPKLISAVPFSPVSGNRLLARDASMRNDLINGALAFSIKNSLSSFHCLFHSELDRHTLKSANLMSRQTIQFHWKNHDYDSFSQFLSRMASRKRKKIRQERNKLVKEKFSFNHITGADITASDWEFFYHCYLLTYRNHNSTPYLSLDFFLKIAEKIPNNMVLIIAKKNGHRVASALNVLGQDKLYGRYWGTTSYFPGLHFEVCYYQALEYCIEHGITSFEGGAQGEHKLSRGLEPVKTFSSHWIADERFRRAISNHLNHEDIGIESYVDELEKHTPFKNNPLEA